MTASASHASAPYRRGLCIALVGAALAQPAAQEADAGHDVRLELRPNKVVLAVTEPLEFDLTVTNAGNRSVLLNGGALYTGHQYWMAITCRMTHPERGFVPLTFAWGPGVVSGRVDVLQVPLGPGDSHTITVRRGDYSYALPQRVQPGTYDLGCTSVSRPSTDPGPAVTPGVWEAPRVRLEFTK